MQKYIANSFIYYKKKYKIKHIYFYKIKYQKNGKKKVESAFKAHVPIKNLISETTLK